MATKKGSHRPPSKKSSGTPLWNTVVVKHKPPSKTGSGGGKDVMSTVDVHEHKPYKKK